MRKREGTKRQDMSMYDALVDSRIEYHDGLPNYAAKLGVNPSTIWRWRNRAYDPFNHLKAGRERFQVDVDLSREDLKSCLKLAWPRLAKLYLTTPTHRQPSRRSHQLSTYPNICQNNHHKAYKA